MRDVFIELGANVKFVSMPGFGHMMPFDSARHSNKFIYENLPGSGFDKWNPFNQEEDKEWDKNGYWGKFDQSLYTGDATPKDIGLREWGFYYYPKQCIKGGCNFQMVYHGCFGNAEEALDFMAPYASKNDLVMLMP